MSVRPMQRVNLAQLDKGGRVTRSQARRVAQGFVVFAAAHLQIRITPLHTTPAVAQRIQRAVAARAAQAQQGDSSMTE